MNERNAMGQARQSAQDAAQRVNEARLKITQALRELESATGRQVTNLGIRSTEGRCAGVTSFLRGVLIDLGPKLAEEWES